MLPVLFSIGSFRIYTFGLFLVISFLIGTFVAWRYGKEEIYEEIILDFILIIISIGFITGRIIFIVENSNIFQGNLLRMFHIFNFPGFSFSWGLLIGFISAFFYAIKKKLKAFLLLDTTLLGFSLSLVLGEIGCLLNGCILGAKTQLPWGVYFVGNLEKRHPLSLYQALITLIIYFILKKVFLNEKNIRKFAPKQEKEAAIGKVTAIFLASIGFTYFLLEFLREGSVYLGGFKGNQIAFLILTVAGSIFLARTISLNKIKEDSKKLLLKIKKPEGDK